jgi:hypothetical protein
MGKHTSIAHAPTLVSLLLLMCFAIQAHCKYWYLLLISSKLIFQDLASSQSLNSNKYFFAHFGYSMFETYMDIKGWYPFLCVGRIIDDKSNEKINLPGGLCAYKKHVSLCKSGYCYCCLITYTCYLTEGICEEECKKSSSSVVGSPTHPSLTSRLV